MKKMPVFLILLILVAGCKGGEIKISDKIMKVIDDNCKPNSSCNISLNDITDFKWDKMVIFDVGSDNSEISESLGVVYEDSIDLMSGMVFVYDKKIVYNERFPYNPEKPNKSLFHFDNKPGSPNLWSFTQNDLVFEGSKRETDDGNYYYEIRPVKTTK